ncbi:helix-turn-helix transcriptional regulator [Streptomyces sp. JV176]|uniref:helix-turn-helix domain-containing protein n=1 Tax=Streptomyces sp. JV176 TaxID=858630 RepID=UPI002E78F74E|nr:helix-turn-helix transcriptional regulator [Streptomyces sp. JV176]MEE1797544.1 helix-turn-helix transcriptional regulator [Streptomyces sp. JV176]
MSGQLVPLPGRQEKKQSRSAPHPLARTVGALLRHHRELKGWTQRDAVNAVPAMGSVPTLSRYETGNQLQDPDRVEVFLRACGASPAVRTEAAQCLRRITHSPAWANPSDVVAEPLAGLFALEATARSIRTYQENVIPGMLQTRGYAKALMSDFSRAQPDEERQRMYSGLVDRRLLIRLQRQTLLDEEHAPEYEALVGEPALMMEVGGRAVLREQLRQFYSFSENRPNIHIRVLLGKALSQGSALHTSMTLITPHDDSVSRAVYLETRNRSGELLVEDADIEMFQASLDDLWTRALDKGESMKVLEHYIGRLHD